MSADFEAALDVKTRHRSRVFGVPGVTGMGVGHDHPTCDCTESGGHHLVVYAHGLEAQVPTEIEGVKVVRKVTGEVKSFALTHRYEVQRPLAQYPVTRPFDSFVRPVAGGNSVGAYSSLLGAYVTGTLGMAFQNTGGTYALSCNHVICGISTKQRGGALAGTPIFQPGSYFGGTPAQEFAHLAQWLDIDEVNQNELDWAAGLVADPSQVSPAVLGIGTPDTVADPVPGLVVQKNGALSGLTTGQVIDTNASIMVNYEDLFIASFDNQIVIDNIGNFNFAQPGDSGSAILVNTGDHVVACGLLFSGSSNIAVANKITNIQKQISIPLPVGTFALPEGAAGGGADLLYAGVAFSSAVGILAKIFL